MENGELELDALLKRSMRFDTDELPEPDPKIQKILRGKVVLRKTPYNNFLNNVWRILTMDIKLYQAALALSLIVIFFITLLTCGTQSKNAAAEGKLLTDSSSTSNAPSLKQDSFLMQNFTRVRN